VVVSFALIGLKLLGLGRAVMQWLSRRSLAELACIALAVFAVVQHFELTSARSSAARWHKQFDAEHAGRLADRAAYTKAQDDAAAANKAHVQAENKLREQINEASRSSFIADRDRLRAQSGGAAGSAGVSEVPKPAPGTPPEVVSLPPAELLRAQETELQLNALIDWILGQSKVDPNK